jgi:hypothetical protein
MVDSALIEERRRAVVYLHDRLCLCDSKYPNAVAFEYGRQEPRLEPRPEEGSRHQVEAVYGVVRLVSGRYVLAVTRSLIIGLICQRKIYQVERAELFPIKPNGRPGEV